MKIKQIIYAFSLAILLASCSSEKKDEKVKVATEFNHFVEQFADIKVLRYSLLFNASRFVW